MGQSIEFQFQNSLQQQKKHEYDLQFMLSVDILAESHQSCWALYSGLGGSFMSQSPPSAHGQLEVPGLAMCSPES